jgi:hypothetical protein
MALVLEIDNDFHARLLEVAGGDKVEAKLLLRSAHRATRSAAQLGGSYDFDNFTLNHFRSSLSGNYGDLFRDAQKLNDQELALEPRRMAFQGVPDSVREEHSAFCLLMYQGKQIRFLDRHPGETPEAFANRPRKTAVNITRVIVNALSRLYAARPARKLAETTADEIKTALVGDKELGVPGIWSDDYDMELLEADRYTRLEGTTSVRPFYDDETPGSIKLVVFHSHQLRIIPNPAKPWKPKAVIERHSPFEGEGQIIIWTEKSFLQLDADGSVDPSSGPHSMGRIPHTFFRDSKAPTGSFFVEGRGRGLCDANAVVNAKLTDLNEVYQYQGFAVPVVTNYDGADELMLGPRRPIEFKDIENGQPHGVEFVAPPSKLGELRAEVNADIDMQFKVNGVPPAATGAPINQRSLSGTSIQQSMRPLLEDFEERARLFTPYDLDLADNALSVRAEHDNGFEYDRASQRPAYQVDYQEPTFPLDTDSRIKGESHDIGNGMRTQPEIMMEQDPDRFPTIEDAILQWKKNLELQRNNTLPEETAGAEEVEGEDLTESLTSPAALTEGATDWVDAELAELREGRDGPAVDFLAAFARGKIQA